MTKETETGSPAQGSPGIARDPRVARGDRLFLLGRLALGFIFILASIDKILNPAAFAESIYNYQLLPDQLINAAAIILPWLEVVLGGLLIIGVWLPGAVVVSTLMLLVFFSALLISMARGLDIHCGCFTSGGEGEPQMLLALLRDALFLLLGFYLFHRTLFRRRTSHR